MQVRAVKKGLTQWLAARVGRGQKRVPGARPIFTSAHEPGLIYDGVSVSPTSLATRNPQGGQDQGGGGLGPMSSATSTIPRPKRMQ
jgi:hypothetical protein